MRTLLPPADPLPAPTDSAPMPRQRLFGPGLLIMLLIVTALAVTVIARQPHGAAAPDFLDSVQMRALRFADQADGSVAAIDDASGKLVQRFEGEQGFLRGTLRALVRERRMRGLGAELPFQLVLHRDGRLTLFDPSAGTRIALESFGPDNARVFARLLP
jgi:putative photosynthetic complex assembly protein